MLWLARHGSPAHTWSQPGDPSGLREGEGCIPKKNTNSVLKEEEMYKVQVKQLLFTKILNPVFQAYEFQSITWEEAPWVVSDKRMGWCVAGNTIPSTTLFSIIKSLSGVCPEFLGGNFLVSEHISVSGGWCVLIPWKEDMGTLGFRPSQPSPPRVFSFGWSWFVAFILRM